MEGDSDDVRMVMLSVYVMPNEAESIVSECQAHPRMTAASWPYRRGPRVLTQSRRRFQGLLLLQRRGHNVV